MAGARKSGAVTVGLDQRIVAVLVTALALASCVSPEKEAEPPVSATPAVLVLLDDARQSERSGQPERTADLLERALRIEPDNAHLWHELARVNLAQGRSRDAIQFATKSNALTRDKDLASDNWLLIARAYTVQGDHELARQARHNAAR